MTTQTGLEQRALFELELTRLKFSASIISKYSEIISALQKQYPGKKLPIKKVDESILLAKLAKLSTAYEAYGIKVLQHFYYLLYRRKVFWHGEPPHRSKLANFILTEKDFYPLLARFKLALSEEKIIENDANIFFYAMASFFVFLKDTNKNIDDFNNADIIAYQDTIRPNLRDNFKLALKYYDYLILKRGSVRDAEVITSFSDKNIEKEAKRIVTKLLKGNIYSALTRKNLQCSVHLVLRVIAVKSVFDIAKGVGMHMQEDVNSPYPLKEVLALIYRSFLPHDLPWIQKGDSLDDKLFSINKFTRMLLKEGVEKAEIANTEEKISQYICWLYRESIDPEREEDLTKFLSRFKSVDERTSTENALKQYQQYQQFQKRNALDENIAALLKERHRQLGRRLPNGRVRIICGLMRHAGKDEFEELTLNDAMLFLGSISDKSINNARDNLAQFYLDILNIPLPKFKTTRKIPACITPNSIVLKEVSQICKRLEEKTDLKEQTINNYIRVLPSLLMHTSKTKIIDIDQKDIDQYAQEFSERSAINAINAIKLIYLQIFDIPHPFKKNLRTEYIPKEYIISFRQKLADKGFPKSSINSYLCVFGCYCKWLEENNHTIEAADAFLVEHACFEINNTKNISCKKTAIYAFYRLVLERNINAEDPYTKLKICLRKIALQQGHSENFIIRMTRKISAFFRWVKKDDFYKISTKDGSQYLSDPSFSHNSKTETYFIFFYTHVLKIDPPSEALSIVILNEWQQQQMRSYLSKIERLSISKKRKSEPIIRKFLVYSTGMDLKKISRIKIKEYVKEAYSKNTSITRYLYLNIICNFINNV